MGTHDFTNSAPSDRNTVQVAHDLADAAKAYNWQKVFKILNEHPDLVNATRPGSKSLYTPLHQAAHGSASPAVIQQLLAMGASLSGSNAQNEIAVDIAKKKGHYHLIPLLTPVTPFLGKSPLLLSPRDIREAKSVCALRFQGYEYAQSVAAAPDGSTGKGLSGLIAPVVEELILHSLNSDNFAAFFGLQRFLYKWGGEYLTTETKEHIAYDYLFLHLYSHVPPEPFRDADYCHQWQNQFLPKAERVAALVRKSFIRRASSENTAL